MPSSNRKWPEVKLYRGTGTPSFVRSLGDDSETYVPLTVLQELEADLAKAETSVTEQEAGLLKDLERVERRAIEAEEERDEILRRIRASVEGNDTGDEDIVDAVMGIVTEAERDAKVKWSSLSPRQEDALNDKRLAATLADSDPPEEPTDCKPASEEETVRWPVVEMVIDVCDDPPRPFLASVQIETRLGVPDAN